MQARSRQQGWVSGKCTQWFARVDERGRVWAAELDRVNYSPDCTGNPGR